MSISLQHGDLKAESHLERLHGGIEELDQPIEAHAYFFGYSGWLPGDSHFSAAQRVLKELRELDEQQAARAKQPGNHRTDTLMEKIMGEPRSCIEPEPWAPCVPGGGSMIDTDGVGEPVEGPEDEFACSRLMLPQAGDQAKPPPKRPRIAGAFAGDEFEDQNMSAGAFPGDDRLATGGEPNDYERTGSHMIWEGCPNLGDD